MFGDGYHEEDFPEPEGSDQVSTSEINEALAKQAHDDPELSGHDSPRNSAEQQHFLKSREGEARASSAIEGSSHMPSQNDIAWVPWIYNPAMLPGGTEFGGGAIRAEVVDGATLPQWLPVLFPFQMPVLYQLPSPGRTGQNGGFYPVPFMVPYLWAIGLPPGTPAMLKFPLTMPAPVTVDAPVTGPTPGQQLVDPGRAQPVRGEVVPLGPMGLVQPNGVPFLGQAGGGQRPEQRRVIRRFQVGIQLDLLLLLKLAVVVFVFNQDGSKDRLLLLLGLAGVIYLYQTGSLASIVRWLAVRAQHIMSAPQQPPQIRPDAQPAPAVLAREPQGDEIADLAPANPAAAPVEAEIAALAEGPAIAEPRRQPQGAFWGLMKELQMLLVGFLTSLLPGFHPRVD